MKKERPILTVLPAPQGYRLLWEIEKEEIELEGMTLPLFYEDVIFIEVQHEWIPDQEDFVRFIRYIGHDMLTSDSGLLVLPDGRVVSLEDQEFENVSAYLKHVRDGQ